MPIYGRQAAMVAVLMMLVLSLASITPGHAVGQMKAGGDDLDDADLLEGIVGEDDLPDEQDQEEDGYHGDFDGEFEHYDDGPDDDADEHWREEEERFFKKFDANGDGNLDLEEYTKLLSDEWHSGEDPAADVGAITGGDSDDELNRMKEHFAEEDQNKDGKISLEEWLAVAFHDDPQEAEYEDGEPGNFENLSEEEMAEIRSEAEKEFQNSDKDKDGKLTLEEIVELVLGDIQEDEEHDIDKSELTEMAKSIFNEMDKNNDTIVDFEEFFKSHMMDPADFDEDMGEYYGDEHMHMAGHYGHDHDDDIDPEDEDDHDMLPGGEDFEIDHLADDRDVDGAEARIQ